MSYEPIRLAVETFMQNGFVDSTGAAPCPVRYGNQPFTPPDGGTWVAMSLSPVDRLDAAVGTTFKRTWMLCSFQILIPLKSSLSASNEIADKLAALFDDVTLAYGATGQIFFEAYKSVGNSSVAGWNMTRGQVRFRADETAA